MIVCDGGLNFDLGEFGVSEFLTTFNQLETVSNVDYQVTLAHRDSIVLSSNPVVTNHISNFKFDTSVNLNNFDQVWLFAIQSSNNISQSEIDAIEDYMDKGGGLFATGDHGRLGRGMCGNIPRVKEMRYWDNFPSINNNTNEVSMGGMRRNDTNQPQAGNSFADTFNHQSDDIPQTIAVRTFGNGLPHPLLSIKTSLRPSGIIDIMPDHPHEGECAPETSFTVNGTTVNTQIIATSFVPGGNTSGGKDATVPHCFPSIAVWDGRQANVGRIVIDSTWHHFVNVNLNGVGTSHSGLINEDFEVIQQYYMNIATWMTRRKFFFCWRKQILFELLMNSQLVEASLNNPTLEVNKIKLADLNSIGVLAEEILSDQYNASFARNFLLELVKDYDASLFNKLNLWESVSKPSKRDLFYESCLNVDLILHTAIGSGFIALRDLIQTKNEDYNEKILAEFDQQFIKGMKLGHTKAVRNFNTEIKNFFKKSREKE